ncbi:hypothetical protein HC031_14115 [Planosporangium thailandense]|uniref:DUF4913 domain-containing protein n=1 Tax=Planosporangium thailandense TaxID=765197 RepID=A0ABX0XXR7_9ACTN|nr:hypothetical protein [Planosporangium thailandense]NJC70843.1 hypothetical protein [Planosporangium thailandense]
MNRPTPDPALVALARDVEQLRREVDQHRADIDRARETGDTAHRVLADLVDRVAAVADDRPVGADNTEDGQHAGVESWLVSPRPEALQELVEWMDQVLIHYPGTVDALGQCWSLHAWIVEELLALRAAWSEAYQGDRAGGTKAVDWHERHRPGVIARITQGTAGCSVEAHQPGGRLDRPIPPVFSTECTATSGRSQRKEVL